MLNSKKTIQGYIIALVIVSTIVGLFLTLTLTQIYGEDNQLCKNVQFEIHDMCRRDASVQFFVKNEFDSPFEFKINGKRNILKYRLNKGEDKKMIVISKDSNIITLLPIIYSNNQNFECNGKVKSFNSEVLPKCQK